MLQGLILLTCVGVWFMPMATEPPDETAWRKGSALVGGAVAALWWLL
jgi:hypothetical protein